MQLKTIEIAPGIWTKIEIRELRLKTINHHKLVLGVFCNKKHKGSRRIWESNLPVMGYDRTTALYGTGGVIVYKCLKCQTIYPKWYLIYLQSKGERWI